MWVPPELAWPCARAVRPSAARSARAERRAARARTAPRSPVPHQRKASHGDNRSPRGPEQRGAIEHEDPVSPAARRRARVLHGPDSPLYGRASEELFALAAAVLMPPLARSSRPSVVTSSGALAAAAARSPPTLCSRRAATRDPCRGQRPAPLGAARSGGKRGLTRRHVMPLSPRRHVTRGCFGPRPHGGPNGEAACRGPLPFLLRMEGAWQRVPRG